MHFCPWFGSVVLETAFQQSIPESRLPKQAQPSLNHGLCPTTGKWGFADPKGALARLAEPAPRGHGGFCASAGLLWELECTTVGLQLRSAGG